MPSLALARMAVSPGMARMSSICVLASGDVGVRQVNFVDDRDDGQVLLRRQMDVGHRLRLDALGGVNDQQRAFARAQAARNFVGKIHVAGRVDQVQLVSLAVLGLVKHRDRMGLDGDAALAFQVHGIEQLLLHVARGDGAGAMQQPVRKRRLPMINMGDDAEISYVCCVHLESLFKQDKGGARRRKGNSLRWRRARLQK